MAVETRYVVVRNGEELKTFMDKKQADQYDQMLDRADAITQLIKQSPVAMDESLLEDLSIYLAENKDDMLVALGAKKPTKPAEPARPEVVKTDKPAAKSSKKQ